MKRFAALMAMIMAFSFTFHVADAEARRFGGGKSFGRSYKTTPAPKRPEAAPLQQQKSTPAADNSRKGMMGGLLGGLLAGGLLASLLGGGFGGGFGGFSIILLALLAFFGYRMYKRAQLAKPLAHAHGPTGQAQSFNSLFSADQPVSGGMPSSNGFAVSDVPMNLPAGFNMTAFLNGARDHYRTIQQAWNVSNFEAMREYLSPELFEQIKAERLSLSGDQHTEVMFVDAQLGRADYNARVAELSIVFTGKVRDTAENIEEAITDIWHLQRDLTVPNAPWLIVGIES